MSGLKKILDKCIEKFIVIILTVMVFVALWQVASRYVFNSPSTISEELLRYCLIWLAMLGSAYMFGLREHISMTFLVEKFSDNVRQKLSILSEVVIIIFSSTVLVYGGINITSLTMKQISAALGISMGYVYMVLPLSGLLMIFYGVNNILNIVKEKNVVESKQIKECS